MKTIIRNKEILLENMVIARDILAHKKIPVFLNFGTLLGAVREKDFIVHDDDVDFEIYERDKDAFLATFPDLEAHGLHFFEHIPAMRLYSFTRGGEQIDFFLAREKKTLRGRRWDLEGRATVPARFLDNLDTIDFLGEPFLVPHDPLGLVRNLYGKTWNIPIEKCPSRLDWSTRAKKIFRNPGKLFFYTKRFITLRLRWSGMKKRSGTDERKAD
jgi:lipopolysaccharide cholinephosphotransferase